MDERFQKKKKMAENSGKRSILEGGRERRLDGEGEIDRGPLEALSRRACRCASRRSDVWRVAITVIQFFGIIFVLKIDD